LNKIGIYQHIKGLVHPKMKIIQLFAHPQAILGVTWLSLFSQIWSEIY